MVTNSVAFLYKCNILQIIPIFVAFVLYNLSLHFKEFSKYFQQYKVLAISDLDDTLRKNEIHLNKSNTRNLKHNDQLQISRRLYSQIYEQTIKKSIEKLLF